MTEQRPLPIEQAEISREAYADAVPGCDLSPTAEKIARWVIDVGEKEMRGGERLMTARLPTHRKLGTRLGCNASSICRALAELKGVGLSIQPVRKSKRIELNLSRVCELSNARATERTPDDGFAPGWRPQQTEPAESEPDQHGAATPDAALHQRGARVQARDRSEKELLQRPRVLTETETEKPRGAVQRPATPCNTTQRGATPCNTPQRPQWQFSPKEIRERIGRLNRSAAWQALQPDTFANEAGGHCVPAIEKLLAAFDAAVAAGLIRDNYGSKLDWLATVHDCTFNAESPGGRLAWRTAAGKLYWPGRKDYEWAKQILRPPAPDDPIVAATAAAFRRPEG